MTKRSMKGIQTRPAPITAQECADYARSLVDRGLASRAILGPIAPSKSQRHSRRWRTNTN